jgi:hypothetical protein
LNVICVLRDCILLAGWLFIFSKFINWSRKSKLLHEFSLLHLFLIDFSLPRIENALPGRDGYEVEIFGMVGIPAPDVADYKRRKEIELGLSAGSISQPPPKRVKVENRPISEEELRRQLEEHKALMGHGLPESSAVVESSSGAVYGAGPQTYTSPPVPVNPGMPPPGIFPPGVPPGSFPGGPPPFPPFMPGFPPQ